jgi:2-polyprenyl-6-hydroxyphenyl methylase/3-demethylubiquinone-9 3-methyltransferase
MSNQHHNVDHAEVSKFEELAHRWWDPNSEFKPLHELNPLRLNFVEQRAGIANKKILDVGCGGGILSEAMAQRGADVSGIDMGETPLQVAKLHSLESGVKVHYEKITAEAYAKQHAAGFDVVTCMEMLEHVPDPASTIAACSTLVKPGGHVFFSTINRSPKSFLFAIVGAEYVLQLLPKGTHHYDKFIRPSELTRWARAAGLKLHSLVGITYNPFTKHYKLENDVSVNYIAHMTKPE